MTHSMKGYSAVLEDVPGYVLVADIVGNKILDLTGHVLCCNIPDIAWKIPMGSFERDEDGMLVRIYDAEGDLATGPDVEIEIEGQEIYEFLLAVNQQGLYTLHDILQNHRIGDYATCGNTRLVWYTKHGRRTNKRCPDCEQNYNAYVERPFDGAPRIRPSEGTTTDD